MGFGAGLTSCATMGARNHSGWPHVGTAHEGSQYGIRDPAFNFDPEDNNNNNNSPINVTYDPFTDVYHCENIGDEDIVVATYSIDEIDGEPVEINDLEVILSPGQSFSYSSTSDLSVVIVNTSESGIQLGGNRILAPEDSLDISI